MKVSVNWLKDYVPIATGPVQVAQALTMAGMEVEAVASTAGDTVFELEITPNRPDCLSVIGLAREAGAVYGKPLKIPKPKKIPRPRKAVGVRIENKKDCPRYMGTLIEDVHIKVSPAFLVRRLTAVGVRSVNNVVDITNFCLLESGQPLHAFDFDKLAGGQIIVRRAKTGESIVTINGERRALDPGILVIADAEKPVAIAGVMGGLDTEVSSETKNILLESAAFDPALIRRASRQLGLSSDSSYRFERGVDVAGVETTARRAVSLILELAGGTVKAFSDKYPGKTKKRPAAIALSAAQVETLLGAKIPLSRCKTILQRLGFGVAASGRQGLRVRSPSFRSDIRIAEDVIEEIARIEGYDKIPARLPAVRHSAVGHDRRLAVKAKIRRVLEGAGLNEIVTYSMTNKEALAKSHVDIGQTVKIKNPLTVDQEVMRPVLLPSFLSVLNTNVNRGQKDIALFELGRVYPQGQEREVAGLLLAGNRAYNWRRARRDAYDFFELKGIIEQIAWALCVRDASFEASSHPACQPGQSVRILVGGHPAGWAGKIDTAVLEAWDIGQPHVFFAELDLKSFMEKTRSDRRYKPVSAYPSVVRDISLAVGEEVEYARIEAIARRLGQPLLRDVTLLEEYRGEKIEDGRRGITVSLTYQSDERTLREKEVDAVHEKICAALTQDLDARRR